MDARPIPALGTHSAFTEIVTAVVGRWQHFVSADPAQKANPVLPRRVSVASNGSNYVTLRILFFADIIVYSNEAYLSQWSAKTSSIASEEKRKDDNIVKKTPKLTTSFTRVASTSAQSDSELILEDNTEQPQSISRSSSLEADADLDSPHHVEIDESEAAGP